MHGKRFPKPPTSAGKKLWSESVVECDIEESETEPCGLYSKRLCLRPRLEMNSNDIEEHHQELSTEELMGLHIVSQPEVTEERLSDEEQVIVKQQSSNEIRETP
ncbi:hypothetical protein AVEN_31993-1 [Araneus ventricosus]|uniref:Uncharacterized protein n=1 Tax=Araneus ventricosus TaxID=182803 RepID=A0A4Y2WKF3_ARAVE|nr:hypothetical protein AVEN_31993-1 [Araneus ventricosus]